MISSNTEGTEIITGNINNYNNHNDDNNIIITTVTTTIIYLLLYGRNDRISYAAKASFYIFVVLMHIHEGATVNF